MDGGGALIGIALVGTALGTALAAADRRGVMERVLGLRDVASFRANEVEINATSFSAVRRDGTVAVWGRIGAGVFGPRVLSLGFPLNLELD